MRIRDLLNKLKWNPGSRLEDYCIVIVHRGEYMDRKVIPGARIIDIGPGGFCYIDEKGRETWIPYHRVVEVKTLSGEAVWRRGEKP